VLACEQTPARLSCKAVAGLIEGAMHTPLFCEPLVILSCGGPAFQVGLGACDGTGLGTPGTGLGIQVPLITSTQITQIQTNLKSLDGWQASKQSQEQTCERAMLCCAFLFLLGMR
jgi:hypothetical protein